MGKVTKRDLNQNTASVLRQVTDSNDVVVTEHGEPKWRISMYRGDETALTRFEREGYYTPPTTDPAPWPSQPSGPKYSEAQIEELLSVMRGDH